MDGKYVYAVVLVKDQSRYTESRHYEQAEDAEKVEYVSDSEDLAKGFLQEAEKRLEEKNDLPDDDTDYQYYEIRFWPVHSK